MPITKVPVIHKFGIISHTQRLELQERLLKQSYLQSIKSKQVASVGRKPLDITDEFISSFNNPNQTLDEKERFEEKARKMIERAKRRAGVRDGGVGAHVNLPLAWTELAQLAQCKGKVQEDCLDILITSLDVSPLEKYHIPALFFLAETMLYWLRTEAVHQPYLRTSEIKLLKMGQLVFTRMFYHHMAGQLQGHSDFKNRLFTYLDGLGECQEAYSPYPNALLSLRFIIEVGKIVLADAPIEPGEVKEGDHLHRHTSNLEEINQATQELYERQSKDEMQSVLSGAISSSVHDLSPTLWHALDVWRCTNHLSGGFHEAIKALAQCGQGLAGENWVDTMVALEILAEAAKTDVAAMRVLHRLAQGQRGTEGLVSPPLSSRSSASGMFSISSDDDGRDEADFQTSKASIFSSKPTLSDIYERSEEGEIGEKKTSQSSAPPSLTSLEEAGTEVDPESREKPPDSLVSAEATGDGTELKGSLRNPREVSFDEKSMQRGAVGVQEGEGAGAVPRGKAGSLLSQGSERTLGLTSTLGTGVDSLRSLRSSQDPMPGTGNRPTIGSTLTEGRESQADSTHTYTNNPQPETLGIIGWHWEVAITYCDLLTEVCLHGSNATIQKMALVGINEDLNAAVKRGYVLSQLPSAGLLDLAFFHPLHEVKDGGPNDWSWRIRYGAIQALVKLCRSLEKDKNREGMRNTAWSILLKTHSVERDDRVLEALKVGQVHTHPEKFLGHALQEFPVTLGGKMAGSLAAIYLPPLPPPVDVQGPRKAALARKKAAVARADALPKRRLARKPMRTSLQEEILLASSLYEPPIDVCTRNSFDLRRIVEDQWRKELQAEMDETEPNRLQTLAAEQQQEEMQHRERMENKQQKLANKKTVAAKDPASTKQAP